MVVALLANLATSVVENQKISRELLVRSVNVALNNTATFTLSVTHELADAVASPFRLLGLDVEMDDGAGLRLLRRSEVGPSVQIRSSLDGVGRTLTFTRFGANLSPGRSDLLSGQRRIRVTGYLGKTPATMQPRILFDGYLRAAAWSAFPPAAQIEAQDASIVYAEKQLAINVADGSGRTRISILREVLAAYGISSGVLDLGANGGGIVKKAISVGGDQNVIDWIRSFIAPTGRRVRFNQKRQIEIGLFAENRTAARSFNFAQLANLQISPPTTLDANRVQTNSTVVTLRSAEINDGGGDSGGSLPQSVTEVLTTGDYLPQSAPKIQSHVDGAISDRTFLPQLRKLVVGRVRTTTSVQTAAHVTTITEVIETYGWYAVKACQFSRDGGGAISWNLGFDVYLFADGSSRGVTDETFQLISKQTTESTYVDGVLTESTVTESKIGPVVVPSSSFGASYVTDDGEAWDTGLERYLDPYLITRTTYQLAPDRIHLRSIFQTISRGNLLPDFTGFIYQNVGDDASGRLADTLRSSAYALQIAAALQPTSNPQSLTAVATDGVRVALSTLITSFQQNDFCENVSELATVAFFALRDLSKWRVEFDAPIDLTTEDGAVITVPVPQVGFGDSPLVAGEVAWDIDLSTGQNTMHVSGWLYPDNLKVA